MASVTTLMEIVQSGRWGWITYLAMSFLFIYYIYSLLYWLKQENSQHLSDQMDIIMLTFLNKDSKFGKTLHQSDT